ncbi:periodic tryptophan protein 2, partial [Tremellales sp. Uapishka_1]
MKANFAFQNLCGTVYRQGNVTFTPDGNCILSPVGNRVSVFDLVNNKSRTLPFENRKNIACIALSPDGNVLISIDEDGRALLVHFRKGTVLHHMNFKKPVQAVSFSPDGKYIAITHGHHIQVWETPSHLAREFAPFVLHRTYTGHFDEVVSIQWSKTSRYFITTSRDMTARLYTLDPVEGFKPKSFGGHRDVVLGAYFSEDEKTIYTVSRDGAVFVWNAKKSISAEDSDVEMDILDLPSTSASAANAAVDHTVAYTRWGISNRHFFNQPGTKVVCSTFHPKTSLLIVGFSTGVFGLWEMPDFTPVHTLSISNEKISSVAVSASGEWLAFGASKLGQLLVWEWQSESYVLKQQGHYYDMNTLAFSSDGQNIATGGEDGKVKVWNATSGFCFVTFPEHSASISTVEFAKQGQVLFSASLDGTVRAYDLIRYRNFRTFTSPTPVQFCSLAVDPSGEVVCAGSLDTFEIYMWSVQTGKLLDILSGHTAPVSGLAFSPTGDQLASSSWDRSIRLWSVFGRSRTTEPITLTSESTALAFRPDGKEICVATLDGQLSFIDVAEGQITSVIEGRRDISGGRKLEDRMTAANNASSKYFNSVTYTADGSCVLAGGSSKYVVIYDCKDGVMIKKFQISENLSLDGTQELLDSRKMTYAGVNEDLLDDGGGNSDLEDRLDVTLPGAAKGDLSKRRYKREAKTNCVRFSYSGRSWAAASTEGLLIYSLDSVTHFDPLDLSIDLTPESILATLQKAEYLLALIMALRLNEGPLIKRVYEGVPINDIRLISNQLPKTYVEQLLRFVSDHLEESPHVEFDLVWIASMLTSHGRLLRESKSEMASLFRNLQKGLMGMQSSVAKLCDDNSFSLQYLISQTQHQRNGNGNGNGMEIEL